MSSVPRARGHSELSTPLAPRSSSEAHWFCIAGIWRSVKDVGEAFTLLTMPPGPDIAPYHDRQIAILDRADWAAWLNPSASPKTILKPLPPGALTVQQVG
jgi:putative SOS response-associated peptidase YedK